MQVNFQHQFKKTNNDSWRVYPNVKKDPAESSKKERYSNLRTFAKFQESRA